MLAEKKTEKERERGADRNAGIYYDSSVPKIQDGQTFCLTATRMINVYPPFTRTEAVFYVVKSPFILAEEKTSSSGTTVLSFLKGATSANG